jgi:hypothetical protein
VLHANSRDSDLRQVTAALHDLPEDAPVLDAALETARLLGAALVVTHGLPVSFAERSVGLASAVEHSRRLLDAAARRLVAEATGLAVVTRLVPRTHTSSSARTSTPACSSSAAHAATATTTSAWWPAPLCTTRPARC